MSTERIKEITAEVDSLNGSIQNANNEYKFLKADGASEAELQAKSSEIKTLIEQKNTLAREVIVILDEDKKKRETNLAEMKEAKNENNQDLVDEKKAELNDLNKQSRAVSTAKSSLKSSVEPIGTPVTPESVSLDIGESKYQVKNYSYPEDLITNEAYGGNYAIFFINQNIDPKLENDPSIKTDFVTEFDQTSRKRGSLIASGLSFAQVTGASSLVGGLKAGGLGLAGGNVKALKAAGGVGGANAVGYTAVGQFAATGTRAQKRLKTAIALHIPNQLVVRYGVNYGEEDTVDFSAAAEVIKAIGGKNKMSDTVNVGTAAAANIALRAGAQNAAVSAATGLAANPKKEQIFKGVDFRVFNFEYQFFPRSPEEAQNVNKIINTFKVNMHPDFRGAGEFLFVYPSEFDIVYYTNGLENQNIHKHTSCVLEEVSVNYTPNGIFNTFFDSSLIGGGMPTQINVTLRFKELQILNKKLIEEGKY
jgi:hypothetical protein